MTGASEDRTKPAGPRAPLPRALLAWLGILVVAVGNGMAREAFLVPRMGDAAAHAISSVTLALLILSLTLAMLRWLRPLTVGDAWAVGGLWLLLTVAFEFLAGHYLFGNSWADLLADYDVARGRIWVLVLLATAVAPRLAFALRGPPGG